MKRLLFLIAFMVLGCAPAPAVDPNYGLLLAEAQASRYEAQLTSTAQAFGMMQVSWTATAQSWTPTATMQPTITPTPTVNVTGTLAVEYMNAEINDLRLENERKQATNQLMAFMPYVVLILSVGLALFIGFVGAKRYSMMPTPIHDGTGKPHPVMNVLEGVVVDIDRQPNGMARTSQKYLASLPAISEQRQAEVTNLAQLVDMKSRTKVSTAALNRLLETQGLDMPKAAGQLTAGNEAGNDGGLFALPAWDLVKGWDRNRDLIPLGNSDNGLEYWNLMQYGHLAMFGRSGAGKSRQGERPLVAFLLAAGQRVVALGKEVDFMPFMGHPNFVFVPIYDVTERDEAIKYYKVLEGAVNEKERRIREMAGHGVSLWQGERTFVVLAELGNTLVDMGNEIGDKTLRKARSVVNEGRKAGLSLVFSSQRPKGFIDITTQCGRVVFQVENEQEKGYALGYSGAKNLPDLSYGYFYRKFGSVKVTGAFEPSDEQIRDFLGTQFVSTLPKEEWIDAVVSDVGVLPTTGRAGSLPEPEPTADDLSIEDTRRVMQLLAMGMSVSAVVREVFGTSGGGKFLRLNDKVKEIKATLEAAGA